MTRPPIRLLHHMACTGGTLIAKCVAGLPGVALLNEIDPLSRLHVAAPKQPFVPSDPITALAYSHNDVDDATRADMFTAQLAVLADALDATGRSLVLRDHSHSHFCVGDTVGDRPSLCDLVARVAPVRAVVTLRHPLASYTSLAMRKWTHFSPATLDEYARRYDAFLKAQGDAPRHRYEDFVTDPASVLTAICTDLDLPFVADFDRTLGVFSLSGDSGRGDGTIAPRPPRPVPAPIVKQARQSAAYRDLCARLGYDADRV